MRRIYIGFLLLALANTLMCHQLAEAQENMQSSVFGNGGGTVGNGDYQLTGTLGQPVTGVSGSASNIVHAGFWYTTIRAPDQLPLISLTPTSFTFNALPGVNPDDQILGITNAGSGVLLWTVSDDADWLFLSPAGGDNTGEIDQVTVSVSIAGLSEGIHTASITISSPNATNSPQVVPVNLFIGNIYERDMELGWNFVSSPLQLQNGDPGVVLFSISTKCNAAWSYESDTGWYVYVPNGPSTLAEMERGKGYLIEMNESGTLVIQGTDPGPDPIHLKAGKWNLVGHNSVSLLPIVNIAPTMPDGTCIYTYDSEEERWLKYFKDGPSFLNDLELLEPGHGYWFYVEQDWTINYF